MGWIFSNANAAPILGMVASKTALIAAVLVVESSVFRAAAAIVLAVMDSMILFFVLRRQSKPLTELGSVIYSRLADPRKRGNAQWEDTLKALDAHMNSCRRSRGSTQALIEESKTHSMKFVLRMKDSVYTTTRINGSVVSIREKLEELRNDIHGSMAAIEEIASTVESFSRQTESQSSAVVQTSASVEEMSASIENVRKVTAKKTESIEALVRRTAEGRSGMENMSRALKDVDGNIAEINQINAVIDDIASQTSLLSMNAAIEAAHAGDAGRGFAVVAGEIRKLSESTTTNAKLISGTLAKIVDAVSDLTKQGARNLSDYNDIHEEVRQLSGALQEINHATRELDIGSREIVGATKTLVDITETIRSGSGEIALSSVELRDSILRIVEKSDHNSEETSRISEVAQDLNTVFLDLANVFLSYEALVAQIDTFQRSEFHDSTGAGSSDLVPIMMQHLLWVIRSRGVLDGRMDVDPAKVVDHTGCRLGKWIREEAPAALKATDRFRSMETAHERMHAIVKEIVASGKKADRETQEADFDKLLEYSADIIEALRSFGQKAKA